MHDVDVLYPDHEEASSFSLPNEPSVVIKAFNVPCPILPATPSLKTRLTELSNLFLKIYRGEWGEVELPDNTFFDILRDLDENDVLTFLTRSPSLEVDPNIIGSAIATHVSLLELQGKINAIIEPTTGEHVSIEQLTSVFPNEVVYFNEVFVDKLYRIGTIPFLALTHQLAGGLLKKYAPSTPVTFFTKGHKTDESNTMLSVMGFARQIGMLKVGLPHIERHDRYMYWLPLEVLAFVFQPPYDKNNFGQRIVQAKAKLATARF